MQILTAGDPDGNDGNDGTSDRDAQAGTGHAGTPASTPVVALAEEDLAAYLQENPGFFQRYGHVLSEVRLPDAAGGRAISLQQRQLEVLRERYRQLEGRLASLVRVGQENDEIADRLARFTRELLLIRNPVEMPARIEAALANQFLVPQVCLRLWRVSPEHQHQPFAAPVNPAVRRYFDEMTVPYCGIKNEITPVDWLPDQGGEVRSVALLALRSGIAPQAAGLVIFASPDPDRFQTGMGTAFLERIGEIASAALGRLMPGGSAIDAAAG